MIRVLALLATQQPALPAELDSYVAQVMKAFEVPGLSLAVVKDGKVLLAKGYGVRRMGDPAPVDGKTRFGIASNIKVFTATGHPLPPRLRDVRPVRHPRAHDPRPPGPSERVRPRRGRSALVASLHL